MTDLESKIPSYYAELTQARLLGIHNLFSSSEFDWAALDGEQRVNQFTTFIYNQEMCNFGYWNGISEIGGFWHALISNKNHYRT